MRLLLLSFSRALWSQLHWRMLLLTVLPFLFSVMIWGVLLYLGLQPLMDSLHNWFAVQGWFQSSGQVLSWAGLENLKPVLVPLLAMWLLLPLMILTALIFVGAIAMPTVVRHLSERRFRQLEKKKGGSLWGGIGVSLATFILFVLLWVVTLPLNLIPPFTFMVQPLLWGWLTYRVMAYDALSEHASAQERLQLIRRHRWPLLAIGVVTGSMGAAPTLVWLGGALGVIFFPLLAAFSIWLYVVVFVFSGLWFAHYSLEALALARAAGPGLVVQNEDSPGNHPGAPPVLKDIN
jgi:hypothetical protein